MQGMAEKGKKEKHEEQVQYAAYKQFCEDIEVEKKTAIKEAKEKIEMLKADIQKYEADAPQRAKDITVHDEDKMTREGDINAATKVHNLENTDYKAQHKDHSESIDALERAIEVLKKQSHFRKLASAVLLEVEKGKTTPL